MTGAGSCWCHLAFSPLVLTRAAAIFRLLVANANTQQAHATCAIGTPVAVSVSLFMPALAVRLAGVHSTDALAAQAIHLLCHRFEMLWLPTQRLPTQVIEN